MAGKIRHLLLRDGRYYARKLVPKPLRAILGKGELRRPLGADRRLALTRLPAALVAINSEIEHGWELLRASDKTRDDARKRLAEPQSPAELAQTHYTERLALDQELRNAGPLWASISIDDEYVDALRLLRAGKLDDDGIDRVIGATLRRYVDRGTLAAERGTPDWRSSARAIADAELEVLARVYDRDEGLPENREVHPPHLSPAPAVQEPPDFAPAVSLRGLLEDHLGYLEASGRGRAGRKAWPKVFEDLLGFLQRQRGLRGGRLEQADDARRLTPEELIAWRDEKLKILSPKTVKDVWIASIKAVLAHAVEDRKLATNVARDIKVRFSAAPRLREKGFSDREATKILAACLRYSPTAISNPATRESGHLTSAKRWGPWLCAFTGARIGEVLQLRKVDVRIDGGIHYLHITPEAGTVKTRSFRDVPIHPQLVDLGFLKFVEESTDGPLFYSKRADPLKLPAQVVAGRLSTWLRKAGIVPVGVSPSHSWRHRFKTLGRDLGLDPRVVDAIQGHAGRTSSDAYGDVSLRAKKSAIDRFAYYDMDASQISQDALLPD